MHRRRLLEAGLLSGATLLTCGWAARAAAPTSRRLVVVFLRGAVDGLSVVVPHAEAAYYRLRPRLAIARPGEANGALDLDGRFGLHPALAPLVPLWQNRSLAFVHACGSPDPTRSHFDAQDYMESGTPGFKRTADGWMNRLLAVLGGTSPVQAVNVGATMPRILSGKEAVASLAGGRRATRSQNLDRPRVASAFADLYAGSEPLDRAYQDGQAARRTIREDLAGEMAMASNGAFGVGALAGDAARLARLMVRDPEVRLGFLSAGGWDTHANQGAQLTNRLRGLGNALATFARELGPIYAETAIVVLSEFGRTVRENGTGGTDHGHGNVLWLMGGVRGGQVLGEWPGLDGASLYEGRDLAVTTDFRDILTALLAQHLGLTASQLARVFPGHTPARRLVLA